MGKLQQTIAGSLATAMLLSGCGQKSECGLPSRHVHKYTKQLNDGIVITEYIDSEELNKHGFDWNSDYIEINKHDEKMYELLNSKKLFVGEDNWDFLFNLMKNHHDWLEFYYEYDVVEVHYETDSKGNITRTWTETRTVSGWTKNPNDSDNTGLVRLYHNQYVGYRLVNRNGEYRLEESGPADDIRDIILEFPYFNEDCTRKTYQQFRFKKSELKNLHPDDFDVFNHPNLDDPTLVLD